MLSLGSFLELFFTLSMVNLIASNPIEYDIKNQQVNASNLEGRHVLQMTLKFSTTSFNDHSLTLEKNTTQGSEKTTSTTQSVEMANFDQKSQYFRYLQNFFKGLLENIKEKPSDGILNESKPSTKYVYEQLNTTQVGRNALNSTENSIDYNQSDNYFAYRYNVFKGSLKKTKSILQDEKSDNGEVILTVGLAFILIICLLIMFRLLLDCYNVFVY